MKDDPIERHNELCDAERSCKMATNIVAQVIENSWKEVSKANKKYAESKKEEDKISEIELTWDSDDVNELLSAIKNMEQVLDKFSVSLFSDQD